jgi:hypothetical protein
MSFGDLVSLLRFSNISAENIGDKKLASSTQITNIPPQKKNGFP